jgi:hypothetical protein
VLVQDGRMITRRSWVLLWVLLAGLTGVVGAALLFAAPPLGSSALSDELPLLFGPSVRPTQVVLEKKGLWVLEQPFYTTADIKVCSTAPFCLVRRVGRALTRMVWMWADAHVYRPAEGGQVRPVCSHRRHGRVYSSRDQQGGLAFIYSHAERCARSQHLPGWVARRLPVGQGHDCQAHETFRQVLASLVSRYPSKN